jgi:hypothetical protein
VDRLEWIITRSAVPLTSSPNCDNTPISPIPNNTYGWGRMDAWAAFQHRQFKAWFYLQPIYR